jgi:hypothetical protein
LGKLTFYDMSRKFKGNIINLANKFHFISSRLYLGYFFWLWHAVKRRTSTPGYIAERSCRGEELLDLAGMMPSPTIV